MNYEDIFRIQFFTKNGHFDFDPFFLCIWAEIPLYLKYGESRVDLSSKVKIFAFSNYTIPTELHSIGKIWLARNLVFLTHPRESVHFSWIKMLTGGYHIFKIKYLNFRQVDSYVKLNFRQGLFSTKNPFEAI